MSSGCGPVGPGNASSSLSTSLGGRCRSTAARFSRACSTVPASGSRIRRGGRRARQSPPGQGSRDAAGRCPAGRRRAAAVPAPGSVGHDRQPVRDAPRQQAPLDRAPGRGCRAPDQSPRRLRPSTRSSRSMSPRSKLLTPQWRISPAPGGHRIPTVSWSGIGPRQWSRYRSRWSVPRRRRLRAQAATVPRRVACEGSTLLTRKTSSRRSAIASPTSSSAPRRRTSRRCRPGSFRGDTLRIAAISSARGSRPWPDARYPARARDRVARREIDASHGECRHATLHRPLPAQIQPRDTRSA